MRKALLLVSLVGSLLFSIGSVAQAQTETAEATEVATAGWPTLARVSFTKEYDELLGLKVDKPVFSKAVKELDGKKITLRGYVIPTEGYKSHKEFVFSAYPYSMCFFCGGAGPETVIEVFATEPIEYSAEAVEVTGILRLNGDDPNALMYRLEEATQ
ncbi:MAG: hypothetical protein AB8F78_15425 [Saprospiraceae bacterium]